MKKYCDLYYTIKKVGVKERNNSTPIPMYAWFIREKNGTVVCSSYDTNDEGEEEYNSKLEAEMDCVDAIEDHYT